MTDRIRRTKIIATLGPSTDDPLVLTKVLAAGVDVVRLNFSHGKTADHKRRVQTVRRAAKALGREVAIIADLQGPKIRIACFEAGEVILVPGQSFTLDANWPEKAGTNERVGIDYKSLPSEVVIDDCLLLDDGRLELQVKQIDEQAIICEVMVGGALKNHKGINRQGGGLSANALTEKDKTDLKAALAMGVAYIAVSFPRCVADIEAARSLVKQFKGDAKIITKFERKEAIDEMEAMIMASDAIMVARGDLGVEIGDAELPAVQKMLIGRARALDKPVITATQMMESMIQSTIPTRAEVSDVANAVLDGTDAVMLSAETATGAHPPKVIAAVHRVCYAVESHPEAQISAHRIESQFERSDEAIAMATMYVANHLAIKAIICLTESGATPLWMSRIRSSIPIYALTRHQSAARRMALYRGVYPLPFDPTQFDRRALNQAAIELLRTRNQVDKGDLVLITKGDFIGTHGKTNSLKILTVL